METRRSRWRLIIYPKFQLTLVLLNFILFSAVFALFLLYQAKSIANLQRMGMAAHLPPTHPYFQLLQYQTHDLRVNMCIAFSGAIMLGSLATLLVTHKLAGPIIRMKGFFNRIGDTGETKEKLSFRKGDFFSELPSVINRALERLKQH